MSKKYLLSQDFTLKTRLKSHNYPTVFGQYFCTLMGKVKESRGGVHYSKGLGRLAEPN